MTNEPPPAWDGAAGTAGGPIFAAALREMAAERELAPEALAAAAGVPSALLDGVLGGSERLTLAQLARLARALKLRAIEFLQRSGLLSLEVYASGLDPLYFLPQGQVRHDARIYMREINPRHAVPERDMLVRNPSLKALASDDLLDPAGKLELELTYLLRVAVQSTGGAL